MNIFRFVPLLALGLSSGFSSAADPPPEFRPLIPKGLYAVEGDLAHVILLGRANDGWHVMESRAGVVTELQFAKRPRSYFAGAREFSLQNGWTIVIPAENDGSHPNFPFGPSIVYPDRPRDDLHPLSLSRTSFEEKGLHSWIDPKFWEPLSPLSPPVSVEIPVFLANPENSLIVLVTDLINRSGFLAGERLGRVDAILHSLPGRVCAQDRKGLIMVDRLAEAEFLRRLSEIPDISFRALKDLDTWSSYDGPAHPSDISSLVRALTSQASGFPVRILAARSLLLQANDQKIPPLWHAPVLEGARKLQRDLKEVFDQIYRLTYDEEVAKAPASGASDGSLREGLANHPFNRLYLSPLIAMHEDILKLAHALGSSEAREFVVRWAGGVSGAGISLIPERFAIPVAGPALAQGNYLDFWLSRLRALLLDADRRGRPLNTEHEMGEEWRMSSNGGSIFKHLGTTGNNIFIHRADQPEADFGYDVLEATAPLVLLGFEDAALVRSAKRAVLQFIIEADHISTRQLKIENERLRFLEFLKILKDGEPAERLDRNVLDALRSFWSTGGLTEENWEKLKTDPVFSPLERSAATTRLASAWRRASGVRRGAPAPYRGNELLYQFLKKLVYPPWEFIHAPGYSETRYYSNVLDIFSELVVTSAQVLRSRGSYEFIVDQILGLAAERRLVLKEGSSPEVRALSAKADGVQRAVQDRIVAALRYLSPEENDDETGQPSCLAILLHPDPYSAWRRPE